MDIPSAAAWSELEDGNGAAGSVLVFDLGGRSCALPLSIVREVAPMCELAQPPGLPPLLAGLLNLRGQMIPVIRPDRLFDLPAIVFQRYSQLLLLRGRSPLAMVSDRVHGIAAIAHSDLRSDAADGVFNRCLAGVVSTAQGPIHVLHAERLLLAQEKQRVAELQELARRRLAKLEGAEG